MKKIPVTSIADRIVKLVTELRKLNDEARLIVGPAICTACGAAWLLRDSEPSQYTHDHGRFVGKYNLRISLERIGDTKDERTRLADTYRSDKIRSR